MSGVSVRVIMTLHPGLHEHFYASSRKSRKYLLHGFVCVEMTDATFLRVHRGISKHLTCMSRSEGNASNVTDISMTSAIKNATCSIFRVSLSQLPVDHENCFDA